MKQLTKYFVLKYKVRCWIICKKNEKCNLFICYYTFLLFPT